MLQVSSFDSQIFGSSGQNQVLDFFSGSPGIKEVVVENGIYATYLAVFDNCDVQMNIEVKEKACLNFFGVFVGDVDARVVASLLENKAIAHVHLFCLVKSGARIRIDGNIRIGSGISDAEGYLVEEQFLLGTPEYLHVRPLLDAASHRIKASHGAKIHRLDEKKLFYMMSKGLSLQESQHIVITGMLQSLFEKLSGVNLEKKQAVLDHILDTLLSYRNFKNSYSAKAG